MMKSLSVEKKETCRCVSADRMMCGMKQEAAGVPGATRRCGCECHSLEPCKEFEHDRCDNLDGMLCSRSYPRTLDVEIDGLKYSRCMHECHDRWKRLGVLVETKEYDLKLTPCLKIECGMCGVLALTELPEDKAGSEFKRQGWTKVKGENFCKDCEPRIKRLLKRMGLYDEPEDDGLDVPC